MIQPNSSFRCQDVDPEPPLDNCGNYGPLIEAVTELLGRLCRQDALRSEAAPEGVETWEGGGCLYLETALTSQPFLEADVNMQAGRIFIRMML